MATVALQWKDHRELLDIIDNLRSHGISRYVDLPEIVVCSDQSSGKSTVLEAISGMSFTTKDNLCTRFATELILRRYPVPRIRVSIIPDHARSEGEKETLQKFSPSISPETLNLGEVVQEAQKVIGLTTDNRSFSTDILRFEISGPTQPHLTVVDLPGLFESGNKEQSEEDAKTVKDLVWEYMERPRSIILAVVSAKSDFALQQVTKCTRKLDPAGTRTLGLIIIRDTLDMGSESEMSYIQLAQNNKYIRFHLGWHVLKSRRYGMRDATAAKRDEAEAQFFATDIWTSLQPSQVGVVSLKSRLSNVLKNQILLQLPTLFKDIEMGIQECKDKLGRLGDSPNTTEEQRQYLGRMSQDFSSLMKDSIDGTYTDSFFGSAMTAVGYKRRLRAVISNMLSDFEENMHKHGKSKRIVGEADGNGENQISRSQFIDEVKILMRRSRGRELPGTFNPLIVGELFSDQCRPWKRLVDGLTTSVVKSVYATIDELLQHIAVEETSNRIFREIIRPGMEVLNSDLQGKINELLAPHHSSHPITYNRYLTDNVQRAQASRRKEEIAKFLREFLHVTNLDNSSRQMTIYVDPKGMLDSLVEIGETDMERYASSIAIDYMEAHYKVALEKFIDNISVLAVERCLIQKLPCLFSPETVSRLQNADVGRLAGESDESSAERSRLSEKLNALEQGLRSLKVLDKHQSKDISEDVYVNPLKRKASGTEIRREV
ncbi:P-loop containing nucleoside triphosphate hydrolase protein [Paecilomyces variotii]|uniref:P-loop containing nucleoside triphosphate hydrolase protein n=1 Tax=Byssochlamys spectabilis TaxID=264951 RepID=A0A443HRT3_BYSSP|nr:P-loop containing nucleoside triphosphate hydrolase protein [Paecilomyces variotii]RWQ94531.1 P-loop containing nucleoside triphosphate hydrolase protein [Paecilomyces variotii]